MHIKAKVCVKAISCAQKTTMQILKRKGTEIFVLNEVLSITNISNSISETEAVAVNLC